MTSPLQSLITEIDSVHTAISDYAEKLSDYLVDPTGTFPVFDETLLTVDDLQVRAKNNQDSSVDLVAGALSSTVYKVAGIARDLGSRAMTKSMMYDLASQQAAVIGDEARSDGGKKVAELRSITPAQAEGQ